MKKDRPMFVKTKDRETSKKMQDEGFQLIDESNGVWTFFYDEERPMTFNKDKITYSNILCF